MNCLQPYTRTRQTVLAELKVCSCARNLQRGREIHEETSQSGQSSCTYVGTALVKMFARCGSMLEARQAFHQIKHPDVLSWTTLILGHAENGESATALEIFSRMKAQGFTPNRFTFVAALKACISLALADDGARRSECLDLGRTIHSEIEMNCEWDSFVYSSLVDMYAKCGSMYDARRIFDTIRQPDVVSWTSLIMGYAEAGDGVKALELFTRMKCQGCMPNSMTFVAALKACTSFALDQHEGGQEECRVRGNQIHLEVGSHMNLYVQNALVDMYAKCGRMSEARQVFDFMKRRDVVSWNALLLGYADNGESSIVLNMFSAMKSEGFSPDSITFVAALKACGMLGSLETGIKIHEDINAGSERDATILITCLVDFYAKCGNMAKAQAVFDSHPRTRDLRTWNALLTGYSRLGATERVFKLLEDMQDAGFQPNVITFLCTLMCCSHAGLVEKASVFFEVMTTKYKIIPTVEHYTCMADILGRSNKLDDAVALLRNMPCRHGAVSWMAVLGACHKWKNAGMGMMAFKTVVSLSDSNAAAYVLMAQIYGSRGMWKEQKMVLEEVKKYWG